MRKVDNEKELADAVERGDDTIVIEGDLGKKILKIKATGKVAWAVAIGALVLASAALILAMPSGGTTVGFTAPPLGVAATVLGVSAAIAAARLAAAAGGTAVLTKLRERYTATRNLHWDVVLKRI